MADTKIYGNVSEMVRDTAPDAEFSSSFEDRIERRKLIKQLLTARACTGLSQQDIAEILGCSQSRVSKLEGMFDNDMRLGDLRRYAEAVGLDFSASFFPRNMKPVDKVKCHVFTIKKHMDDLALLARTDERIAEGVGGVFFELFANFIRLVGDSANLLPKRPDDSPYFSVRFAEEPEETVYDPAPCCAESSRLSEAVP